MIAKRYIITFAAALLLGTISSVKVKYYKILISTLDYLKRNALFPNQKQQNGKKLESLTFSGRSFWNE